MSDNTRQRLTWDTSRKREAAKPETTDIYPHKMDHGWDEPLAGGTDVMRRVQNELLREQGLPERPDSRKVAAVDDPFHDLTAAALEFRMAANASGDKRLVKLASQVEKLVDDISDHLAAEE